MIAFNNPYHTFRAKVDSKLNNWENQLSKRASSTRKTDFFLVGRLAGASKVVTGAAQVAVAPILGVSSLISRPFTKNFGRELYQGAWTQLNHGVGNVMAGALETTVLGPAIGRIRKFMTDLQEKREDLHVYNPQHLGKFMPYTTLPYQASEDSSKQWEIRGGTEEQRPTVREKAKKMEGWFRFYEGGSTEELTEESKRIFAENAVWKVRIKNL